MREELEKKIEELENLIRTNPTYQERQKLKQKLEKDKKLIREIEKCNQMNQSTKEYQQEKRKLYENEDYRQYQKLENELYFLTLEINHHLTRLTGNGGHSCENH